MTRALHKKDVCTLSPDSLQATLDPYLDGEALIVGVHDDRLKSLLQIDGQTLLFNDQLDFDDADIFTAPLYDRHAEQASHFPRNKDERFHFETNSRSTVISLFPKCGYFQRGAPFLDFTRIVEPGGTLVAVTGLQPESPADHDAKWWVPNSDDAELDEIVVLRYEEFQTPVLLSVFTVTGETARHENATIVTDGA